MRFFIFLFCWQIVLGSYAQNLPDSVRIDSTLNRVLADSLLKRPQKSKIDPRKISLHCAIVPGWGHIELKQYWAPPLIYGGLVFAGLSIKTNGEKYRLFRDAYLAASDTQQKQTVNGISYDVNQLRRIKDGYRRNRELSYLSVIGIWAFQIIEANVSAHLKTFDVSEDISLKLKPSLINTPSFGYAAGLSITLNLK